mgnify:CR=1 FL=1
MNTIMILFTTFTLSVTGEIFNNSYQYSNNEYIPEGGYMPLDERGEWRYPCQYIDDGVCDEGPDYQYCLPGTDTNDCCENGTLKIWNETDINFGRDLSDAICEDFILDYRRMTTITPIQEEVTPMTCSGVLECRKTLQSEKVEKKETKDQFLSSLFFQFIFIYCCSIYYNRIIDGLVFMKDNIEILFKIWCKILKCIIYLFLLAVSIGALVSAIGDQEKEFTLLKIMGVITFLDYIDKEEDDTEDEYEEYQRWRRRRDRYNH